MSVLFSLRVEVVSRHFHQHLGNGMQTCYCKLLSEMLNKQTSTEQNVCVISQQCMCVYNTLRLTSKKEEHPGIKGLRVEECLHLF